MLDGLSEIKESIFKIRNAVKFVKASQRRYQDFQEYVKQMGILSDKGLSLDVCIRWNSTYFMLKSTIPFQKTFNLMKVLNFDFSETPTMGDWKNVEMICDFLGLFYHATNVFSGSHYVTSNLFFHEIYQIQE